LRLINLVQKKTKILVVGPLPPPYTGGVASFVSCLCSSKIFNKEYRVSCLDIAVRSRWKRFTLFRCLLSLRIMFRLFFALFKEPPDLVHIHTSSYWSFFEKSFLLLLCRLIGKHTLLHIHGACFDKFYYGTRFKAFVRFVLNRADAVIAVSPYWKKFLETVSVARVFTVPNLAENKFFIGKEPKAGAKDMLYVGRISRDKGVYELLDAVEILRGEAFTNRLVLAGGEVEPGEIRRVKDTILERKIACIELTGEINSDKVLELLQGAAIFIIPSYAEGLPIAMLEAMAAGLPVVATPVGGIPDVIVDGENGFLVPVGQSRPLAEKIGLLLKDESLCRRMGDRNYKLVLERHHPDRAVEKLIELYKSILEQRG